MPFKLIKSGPDKGKMISPEGKVVSKKQGTAINIAESKKRKKK